jgi:lysophospholipase L1-like esterase
MAQHQHIAALGSSFAAGPGIDPIIDQAAMRSGRNYPHLLAEQLGARLTDLTVSGATTATILSESQITMDGTKFAPQIYGLPEDADLVTVTAGGNDLRFIGSMLFTAWRKADPGNPFLQMLAAEYEAGIPNPSDADIQAAAHGLARIVVEARNRAPNARVLLVDYLTVLADSSSGVDEWFTREETTALHRIQDCLIEAYAEAAAEADAELIRASALSADHSLGTAEPWISGLQTDLRLIAGSFHPNARNRTLPPGAGPGLLAQSRADKEPDDARRIDRLAGLAPGLCQRRIAGLAPVAIEARRHDDDFVDLSLLLHL